MCQPRHLMLRVKETQIELKMFPRETTCRYGDILILES